MEEKDILVFCKRIVNKKTLTRKEKEQIIELCTKYNIKLNTNCRNCYIDACFSIYNLFKNDKNVTTDTATDTEQKYILKKGVDVIFDGMRINDATLTDNLARKIIKLGFNKKYFAKLDDEI